MANTLLNVTAVSKTYGKQKVLDNISFDINTQQKSKANQSSVFKPLSTNNWF
ncbi:hypothetical protein [Streptococcus suis]|uniref:hypothetical protein n=1 Tax=Streptococcus suis TaxID=1307 RepID=UPI0038BA6C3E